MSAARGYCRSAVKLDRPPRFIFENLRDLWLAHESLTGAIMALNRASWAGAIPILVNLQQVDRVICGLYNRAEPGFPSERVATFKASSGEPQAEAPVESNQNG